MISRGEMILLLAPFLLLLHPPGALAGEIKGSVVAGFDSYTEHYSVTQTTTFNQLTEFRTRLNIRYLHGVLLADYVQIGGQSLIGQESLETSGRVNLGRRIAATRIALDNVITHRTFRDNSSYVFANDFLRYNLRALLWREVLPGFSLGVTDRLEIVDFAERTEFDYDHVRNGIELAAVFDTDFTRSYRTAIGYVTKSVADSTEISYGAYTAAVEYRHTFGLYRQIFLTLDAERRIYADARTKSPFWSMHSNATIQPFTVGRFGLTFDNVFEHYAYDSSTDIYFDYLENRSALQIAYFNSPYFSMAVGPTYGFLSSGTSSHDEYTEIGGKVSVGYNSGRRLWLSASYEPGRRDYKKDFINDTAVIFSDFVYHRILLFATFRLWGNAGVNVFANLEPEDHKVQVDDTTTTLFSTEVSYSF
jgi:hypothetical protein